MKQIAAVLTILLVLGLAAIPAGAKELTLNNCIELALENRASIIRARGEVDRAGADKRAALGAFMPTLRASYSWSKSKDFKIDPATAGAELGGWEVYFDTTVIGTQSAVDARVRATDTTFFSFDEQTIGPNKSLGFQANMDIFNPATWFGYSAAGAGQARARLDVLSSEQDMMTAVKISYYAYLAADQNVAVQEEAVRRADEQLKLIESRYELGSAAKSDVLKQKVQYGNDQLAMLRATNAVINTKADLAYTIGLDPSEEHTFSTKFVVLEYSGSLGDAIGFGMEHNPRYLASQKSVDQAGHNLRAARSNYLPTVSTYFNYSKFNGVQAFPTAVDWASNSYSYGVTVSYNIFDGFFRESRVTGAKVQRNNARADLADIKNSTVARVKTSYLEIEQFNKQIEVSNENIAAAEEDLRITQEKYNLGAATILDLLDAQVSLKQAQVALIRVQFDLNLAVARLENAMGKI